MSSTRGVTFLARPEPLIAISIAGAILAVVFAILLVANGEKGVMESMLVGLAIGLPAILYAKWGMGKHVDFYAQFFTMSLRERLTWPVQKKNWLYGWPMILAWPLLTIAWRWLGISVVCSWMIVVALQALVYPEQKAIYEAAKARLAEDRRRIADA